MGISLSCTSKLRILEKAGETSKNLLVEKLKTNPRMKITGDNLDMYIKTNHQRQDNDNKDIHWFASNAFLSRLDYTGLSLEKPNKAYKALYTAESLCTPGTLFHAKTILRRQDVTGNVKSNYKAHEDLFLLMVKALLHVAADQIQVQDSEDRDYILSQLYSKSTCKYFGELVNYLLLTKHLLSPEMSLRTLEGALINTKGGQGKNKEADLVQYVIRSKKDLIRSLGANKTEKAVMRACGAADTCVGVGRTVDGCLGLPKLSVNHTKKSSVKDLEILVKCLKTVDPFTYHKGRNLKSFCNIRKHPDRIINMEEMLDLIRKKVRKFFIDHS
ncbi:unnamed protein product [Mytilus edulis]|uniref:Uncharacterized protein n=1 Tax=Mytilus edulis TaxID=6550 RepID=A0A8S3TMC7_MYTED|nr:unnamed protein product [Mytilus edulis]